MFPKVPFLSLPCVCDVNLDSGLGVPSCVASEDRPWIDAEGYFPTILFITSGSTQNKLRENTITATMLKLKKTFKI